LEPAAASVAAASASDVPEVALAGAAAPPVAVDDAPAEAVEVVVIVVDEPEAATPACGRNLRKSHPPIARSATRVIATMTRVPPAPDVRAGEPGCGVTGGRGPLKGDALTGGAALTAPAGVHAVPQLSQKP
jgi:hypothetical protein